jgi:hypothetical protein
MLIANSLFQCSLSSVRRLGMEVATSWRCDVVSTNQASSACCVFICVIKTLITPTTMLAAKN